jgi:hypothetical protein
MSMATARRMLLAYQCLLYASTFVLYQLLAMRVSAVIASRIVSTPSASTTTTPAVLLDICNPWWIDPVVGVALVVFCVGSGTLSFWVSYYVHTRTRSSLRANELLFGVSMYCILVAILGSFFAPSAALEQVRIYCGDASGYPSSMTLITAGLLIGTAPADFLLYYFLFFDPRFFDDCDYADRYPVHE